MRLRLILWLLLPVLLILHQDYWQWENADLWFGFLPQTLLYHAVLTVVAAVYWLLMVLFAWPTDLEPTREARVTTDPKPRPLSATKKAQVEKVSA